MAQGWVIVHQAPTEPRVCPNEDGQPLYGPDEEQSAWGLALTAGHEKLGVLVVYYKHARPFSAEEMKTVRTFINQAAQALKKARLLDQVQRANHAADVVTRVTALGGREVMLEAIAQGTWEAVRCDAVTLYVHASGCTSPAKRAQPGRRGRGRLAGCARQRANVAAWV